MGYLGSRMVKCAACGGAHLPGDHAPKWEVLEIEEDAEPPEDESVWSRAKCVWRHDAEDAALAVGTEQGCWDSECEAPYLDGGVEYLVRRVDKPDEVHRVLVHAEAEVNYYADERGL